MNLDIIFEKLHRYVYKYCFQSTNKNWGLPTRYDYINRNNKYKKYNNIILKVYELLTPYFKGWRYRLEKKHLHETKYKRYFK